MKKVWTKIRHGFKFNGSSFNREELKEVAYSLVKEGEDYEIEIGDFLLDWLTDSPTVTVSSSGSTKAPEMLHLRKEHMVNSARATGAFFGLQEGNSALLCLPAAYIAGKMMLVRAMVLGLQIDCIIPSSNPLETIGRDYDFGAMVPLQLENSLGKLDRIKTLIIGGAPLPQHLKQKVLKAATDVWETYGMTETASHIAIRKINGSLQATPGHSPNNRESGPVETYFKTLPGVTLEKDDKGCLIVHAPAIAQDPIVTGDLVQLKSDTEFLWLGRHDHLINSGGIKILPEKIEEKLSGVMSCRYFVAGLPDEKLGQKLVLVTEGKVEEEQLFKLIKSGGNLQKFEIPKAVYSIEKFAETPSGKINRRATMDQLNP
ncbi:MAG TPA: AMP-binding protein [Eudoraea sp.]|nr:AMP-binding protein [Eudoraea sp.]